MKPGFFANLTPEQQQAVLAETRRGISVHNGVAHFDDEAAPSATPNRIVQHVPGFVDLGDEPRKEAAFATVEELAAIPFVSGWLEEPDTRLCVSDGRRLMIESTKRRWWWVIGYLERDVPELPRWVYPGDS